MTDLRELNDDHPSQCTDCLALDAEQPTWYKPCSDCHAMIERWHGEEHVTCDNCGALYNAFGNRLRDDALSNPSMYDDNISDLDGYEMQHADDY